MKYIITESHIGILRRYGRIEELFNDYLLTHNVTPFDKFDSFFQSLCWDIAVDMTDRTKMDQDSYVTLRNQIIQFIKNHFYEEYKEWWDRRKNRINESVDKNKRLLINVMGEDLTGKIKQIKSGYDIPIVFRKYLELGGVKKQIDMVGPMYYVKIGGKGYLYQDQGKFYQSHNDASFGEMFMGEDGKRDYSGKVPEQLGVSELGLKFSDIIDMFYNEGKSLNMNVDDKKIKVMERIINDVFSEYDWYEGVDTKVETYVIRNPEYRVPDYIFDIMSNDRRQANIDVIEYEDYINEMFNSLFPKDKINNRVSAVSTIRIA